MIQIVLIIAALVVVFLLYQNKQNKQLVGLPPLVGGSIPFLGHSFQIISNPGKFFTNARKQCGDIYTVKVLSRPTVIISSREYFRDFYSAREVDLSFHAFLQSILTNRFMYGEDQTPLGKLSIVVFKRFLVEKLDYSVFKHIGADVDALPKSGTLDLLAFARRVIGKVLSFMAFDTYIGDDICNKMVSLEALITRAAGVTMLCGQAVTRLLLVRGIDKLRNEIIADLVPFAHNAKHSAAPTIMMKHLMTCKKEDGSVLTDAEIAMNFAGLFFAAVQNTAVGAANLLLVAASHTKETAILKEDLKVNSIAESQLLHSWALETARLSKGWVGGMRLVGKEGFEIAGYVLPEGLSVMTEVQSASLENNEFDGFATFDPSRFVNMESEETKRWGVLNWGSGKHLCPGKTLALVDMKYVLAEVLARMNIEQPQKPFARQNEVFLPMHVHPNYVVSYQKF